MDAAGLPWALSAREDDEGGPGVSDDDGGEGAAAGGGGGGGGGGGVDEVEDVEDPPGDRLTKENLARGFSFARKRDNLFSTSLRLYPSAPSLTPPTFQHPNRGGRGGMSQGLTSSYCR